jgi:hypothetical protein
MCLRPVLMERHGIEVSRQISSVQNAALSEWEHLGYHPMLHPYDSGSSHYLALIVSVDCVM